MSSGHQESQTTVMGQRQTLRFGGDQESGTTTNQLELKDSCVNYIVSISTVFMKYAFHSLLE